MNEIGQVMIEMIMPLSPSHMSTPWLYCSSQLAYIINGLQNDPSKRFTLSHTYHLLFHYHVNTRSRVYSTYVPPDRQLAGIVGTSNISSLPRFISMVGPHPIQYVLRPRIIYPTSLSAFLSRLDFFFSKSLLLLLLMRTMAIICLRP
jgi:hypothetical protein